MTAIGKMVTLLVATTIDPASINPAKAFLSMIPAWKPGPNFDGIRSFKIGEELRLLEHDKSIIVEDDLDLRWEKVSDGEIVDEVIFFSKHTAVSNRPALTIHPIGIPHLKEGDALPQGGKPAWAAPPCPRIGPWLILLKQIAQSHNLIPEFEITLEATHHGPVTSKPTMFIEIGSTEEYWKRDDAARVIAQIFFLDPLMAPTYSSSHPSPPLTKSNSLMKLVHEGLGLGEGSSVGKWSSTSEKKKVLLGLGGGHYVPRHMDIILKEDVWVGHLLSGYSLPMDDPSQNKEKSNSADGVGGLWKQAITVAFDATQAAFPGGEVLAHLDHKSFKSWQKNAIIEFLSMQGIKVGKPNDFH